MPSLLVRASTHSFHHTPTSQLRLPKQKSWIPGTQKQAPARHLSTQHLKFSNKQNGFKEQRKPIPNWWLASCIIQSFPHLQSINLLSTVRTIRDEAVCAFPAINHRSLKTTWHKIRAGLHTLWLKIPEAWQNNKKSSLGWKILYEVFDKNLLKIDVSMYSSCHFWSLSIYILISFPLTPVLWEADGEDEWEGLAKETP